MKKLLVGSLVFLGLAILVLGPATVMRHASQAVGAARQGVENSIPMDYQLDQLEEMLNDFAPKVEQAKVDLARGQVEVRHLEQEIASLDRRQDTARQALAVQNDRLKGTIQVAYVIGGRQYSRDYLERALRNDFEAFKKREAILVTKRSQLDSQRATVLAAEQRLEAVNGEKLELEASVAEMRARLRQIEAMEVASKRFNLDDDGVLARARSLADRLTHRLDVAQQFIENEVGATSPSSVELGDPNESLSQQVEAYLGGETQSTSTNVAASLPR